jgi:hypothetical protein
MDVSSEPWSPIENRWSNKKPRNIHHHSLLGDALKFWDNHLKKNALKTPSFHIRHQENEMNSTINYNVSVDRRTI